MEYLPIIITVALAHFLAVISPGPDFIMITRNSLIYSRKAGIYCAIGVGFGLIISQSVLLFNIIKYIGAAYLIYIGYKSLTSKSSKINVDVENKKKDLSKMEALKIGFITNVTNPKATLFFLSLFTLVITPSTPMYIKILMGAEMAIVTALWFIFVAVIISHPLVKNRVSHIQHFAEKFIGVVLIALGIKVALSSSK